MTFVELIIFCVILTVILNFLIGDARPCKDDTFNENTDDYPELIGNHTMASNNVSDFTGVRVSYAYPSRFED